MLNPVRSTASEHDQAASLVRCAPMIAPHQTAADQGIGFTQQPVPRDLTEASRFKIATEEGDLDSARTS
jgi:hypothetical protein